MTLDERNRSMQSFFNEKADGYDAVISSSSLHHFTAQDKARLYQKIHAALKTDGVFLNSDCIASTKEEEEAAFRDFEENKDKKPHIDTPLFWENERALLLSAGFSDVSFTDLSNPRYKLLVAKKEMPSNSHT